MKMNWKMCLLAVLIGMPAMARDAHKYPTAPKLDPVQAKYLRQVNPQMVAALESALRDLHMRSVMTARNDMKRHATN